MKLILKTANTMFIVAMMVLHAPMAVHAQGAKIGFVSLDRITTESDLATAASSKLAQEFSKREKELAELGETLKTTSEKLEKESATLSDAVRATRQKQLVDMDREFQRKRRAFQEDVNTRKNEELQTVIDRANKAIRQIAESEKYDLIVQEGVYINAKLDITDKVIKQMNGK